jgi:hypothetical protein
MDLAYSPTGFIGNATPAKARVENSNPRVVRRRE